MRSTRVGPGKNRRANRGPPPCSNSSPICRRPRPTRSSERWRPAQPPRSNTIGAIEPGPNNCHPEDPGGYGSSWLGAALARPAAAPNGWGRRSRRGVVGSPWWGRPQPTRATLWSRAKQGSWLFRPITSGRFTSPAKPALGDAIKSEQVRMTAAIFYAKTKMGWKETGVNEQANKDDKPFLVDDARQRLIDEIDRLRARKEQKGE